MKILLFSYSFGKNLNMFINHEISYLSTHHQLKCVCRNYKNEFRIDDVETIEFDKSSLTQKIYSKLYHYDMLLTFRNQNFSKKVNAIINEFKPDVIHCHFAYEALMLLDNIKTNIPIIIHFHGYGASKCLLKRSYVKKMNHYLQQDNIYPIYVSDAMKKNLDQKNLPTNKGMKLYYGINLNHFNSTDLDKNNTPFTFLQVSSLVEKKGIDFTLQAFALFLNEKNKNDYQLILTGDNEKDLRKYKELVKTLGIEQQVVFYGRASREQVKELMNSANCFVHHSITAKNGDQEGIPNAIMEAMAMKLPVLSTFHAGIPELVKDGINGYLVEEKDVINYAKRMNDILSWKQLDENRAVVEQKFNMIIHNQQLEAFYRKITAN